MGKSTLHLTIDNELVDIAKSINLNLSQEFEEWIRIRLNEQKDNKPVIDVDTEIAKLELQKQQLLKQKDIKQQEINKIDAENQSIDYIIDNMIKSKEDLMNIPEPRIHGLQFIMKRKYHKDLNSLEAKELLIKRLKDRNLIKENENGQRAIG